MDLAAAQDGDTAAMRMRARPVPRITVRAFFEEPHTAAAMENAAEDRRLAKTHVKTEMGGMQAAVSHFAENPTPNLILVESTLDRASMLADLDRLAETCDAGTKVIVIGHVNDVLLYRELLKRGVSEYLVAPVAPLQLMESISNLYTSPDSDPIGRAIAFVGAKGGVGSSTICHNVAWSMAEILKTDVVIADLDLAFGTSGLDFNQDPVQGIAEALASPERLDEVLLDRLLTKCSEHLSLFAAPVVLDRDYDTSPEACETVLDVVRQNVPYVAIDLPHIWTAWTKRVLLSADEVVITAVPDLANLRNGKNLLDLLRQARHHDGPPHLVLNMANMPKRPEINAKEFCQNLDISPAAVIEFDAESFGQAANNGQMIEELNRKAKAVQPFRELAMALANRREVASPASRFPLAPLLEKLKLRR